MTTKECPGCEITKPLVEFAMDASRPGGRAGHCKGCRNARRGPKLSWPGKERAARYVYAYLREHACVDCGISDVRVLEFDHMGDKAFDLSRMVNTGKPLPLIEQEIAKCLVRCRNCHQIRTHEASNAWRFRFWREEQEVQWTV